MTIEEAIKDIRENIHPSVGGISLEIAIEALEKQIPKKPKEVEEKDEEEFYYLAFTCPSCDEAVVGQPYRPNFCKHCGQAIDWSEQ